MHSKTSKIPTYMILGHILLLVIILGLSACSGEVAPRADSYALPEEATLKLHELFRISNLAPGTYFTDIRGIYLLEDGNLIVRNGVDPELYEFTRDGERIGVIGRVGRGPGEFLEISKALLTKGDTLHTFDSRGLRHQVWAKNEDGTWRVARERRGELGSFIQLISRDIPNQVAAGPNGSKYGVFKQSPTHFDADTVNNFYHRLAPVDHNLQPADSFSRKKRTQQAIVNSGPIRWNSRFFKAFYFYEPQSDKVIYIRNNSNEIVGIDSTGHDRVMGYLPFERFPRSEEAEQRLREFVQRAEGLPITISPDYLENSLELMLPHEPYYWDVIFDGERLWVHLARSDDTKPDWVVAELDGEILGSFHGPPLERTNTFSQNRIAVRSNRIYGEVESSDGTVYLAGYKLVGLD